MTIDTPQSALREIRNLGFPEVFNQLYDNQTPAELIGSCSSPRRYFKILPGIIKVVPEATHWLPLWETNLDSIVAYDIANDSFVRYYYGDDKVESLGKSYQQFVSVFFLELVDSGIWDELEELAKKFKYLHSEELRVFVASCDDSSFEDSNRRFIESIVD